jgi:YrbI family 3-deoxy-D-manno-octulosonate 8-phosphate phosphatase
VVLDFDGVFTDDRVLVDSEGREAVLCDRSDGRAMQALGVEVEILVLSSEVNAVVSSRCEKLGLRWSQGHGTGKGAVLRDELSRRNVQATRVLYVGNDTNDLECLSIVGYPVAVADASTEAQSAARHVLSQRGGRGALRELAQLLLGRTV